jgi:uncharacterized protein involved in cysteine biosynthesis
MRAVDGFVEGMSFWWKGWRYLVVRRRLLALALAPTLLALIATTLLLLTILSYLPWWMQTLIRYWVGLPDGFWHNLLYYPLLIGSAFLFLVSSIYVVYVMQGLIAIPFYSMLADRTLEELGKKPQAIRWRHWFALQVRGVVKSLVLLMIGVVLLVLSFIPVLNLLALVAAMLILAFDLLDYSFEVLGFDLRTRLRYCRRERAQWAGMATGLALTLLIPGLTLLVTPGAVVGGALLVKPQDLLPK